MVCYSSINVDIFDVVNPGFTFQISHQFRIISKNLTNSWKHILSAGDYEFLAAEISNSSLLQKISEKLMN